MQNSKTRNRAFYLLGILILISLVLLFRQQRHKIEQQKAMHLEEMLNTEKLIRAKKSAGHMKLLSQLFAHIDQELIGNTTRSLSPSTIKRIALLSDTFEEDNCFYEDQDSLSVHFNVERGLLLKTLLALELDSITFDSIKEQTTFALADLKKAELSDVNLDGIDLECANLREANLSGSSLRYSNLRGASLRGTNIESADFSFSQLNRIDLSWSNMVGSIFRDVLMRGTHMTGASAKKARITNSDLRYSYMHGALFNNANLDSTDVFTTDLTNVNFSGTSLVNAKFKRSNLVGAIFDRSNLETAYFDETVVGNAEWIDRLETDQVEGVGHVRSHHAMSNQPNANGHYLVNRIVK